MKRVVLAFLGTPLLVLAGLAGSYGIWLLTTDDPDGGRHPVGVMVSGGSALVGLVALGLLFFATRR
jgi:hypothetical protein